MKISKPVLYSWLGITFCIAAVAVFGMLSEMTKVSGQYDGFAKCLSENGITMYGASWCPHCNAQKQMFGNSWMYMNYVECSLPNKGGQAQECVKARITSYPTCEFQNGLRIEGDIPLEKISSLSGCKLE
jgi:glutaredoxin